METTIKGLGFMVYSPPYVDRTWLWVVHNEIPIYPVFYVRKGDYRFSTVLGFTTLHCEQAMIPHSNRAAD